MYVFIQKSVVILIRIHMIIFMLCMDRLKLYSIDQYLDYF